MAGSIVGLHFYVTRYHKFISHLTNSSTLFFTTGCVNLTYILSNVFSLETISNESPIHIYILLVALNAAAVWNRHVCFVPVNGPSSDIDSGNSTRIEAEGANGLVGA